MLTASESITCQWDIDDEDGDATQCLKVSRFVVARSDDDQSFGWDGEHESCEEHLANVVGSMVNGDDKVSAIVVIRWDGG